MNHKQRILAAIRHEPVDRVPTDMWATPEVTRKLYRYFGVDNTVDLYDALDIDGIMGIAPPYIGPAPRRETGYWENEWGMGYRNQAYGASAEAAGEYGEQVHFPLQQATCIADLEAYPWPSPDWYDYSQLPRLAAGYPGRAIMCGYTAVFYYHNQLRGLEQSLMDPLEYPDLTRYIVQRLSDFFHEYHRRCFEAAPGLIDVAQVTDDWGSQHGLLVSPRIFRQFYQAATQRAIDQARACGIAVFHHDDGDMRPLLPTLVDMGIQILNPVQWRCGNWDLAAIKRDFGARICFHSAVDNQATLPFGSADDVRREVKWLIDTLACDGTGFILGPCHNLQAVSPIENIVAMYESAREYGVR